jgi:hypothetical protein
MAEKVLELQRDRKQTYVTDATTAEQARDMSCISQVSYSHLQQQYEGVSKSFRTES